MKRIMGYFKERFFFVNHFLYHPEFKPIIVFNYLIGIEIILTSLRTVINNDLAFVHIQAIHE